MPCYHPLVAYHALEGNITFNRDHAFFPNQPIDLPCGRCLGCRLEKAKEWALRCSHEASLYDDGINNSFITLTYAPRHLPPNGNLVKKHFQDFIKRLRARNYKKKINPETGRIKKYFKPVRYYMCGEYGDTTYRPHYHALLFNYRFPDCKLVNVRKGNRVYTSKKLEHLWRLGACEIGSVTFQSAGYVARYILKKQQGNAAETFKRYAIVDPLTGEMTSKQLEYTNMSLKPGIGEKWYEQNKSDCFPHDFCVLPDGRQTTVPTYYQTILQKEDPKLFEELRKIRILRARSNKDNSPARLATREICQTRKVKQLPRDQI